GASRRRVTPAERRRLAAGAEAALRTGAPIAVHCEQGTMAHELLDLLAGRGVAARRVALAHLDRNPDPGLHAELAERGAFLMYDGAGKVKYHPDSLLIELVAAMAAAGPPRTAPPRVCPAPAPAHGARRRPGRPAGGPQPSAPARVRAAGGVAGRPGGRGGAGAWLTATTWGWSARARPGRPPRSRPPAPG